MDESFLDHLAASASSNQYLSAVFTILSQEPYKIGVVASIDMPDTKITVLNDGSIRMEGDFEIFDPQGEKFGLAGRKVISLCRCGASQNKPFCDGSHARTGFQDKVVARELPPPKPKF